MYIRPNANAKVTETRQKNDLFRKFKDYFIGATEKEFYQFGYYSTEGYISVNPSIEEKIFDTLSHNIDEMIPITGATGIGKTYLLLYCLKKYYGVDSVSTNNPELYPLPDGTYDVVYYSDFTITELSLLKEPEKLILAKIKAIYKRLEAHFDVAEPDVESYIQANKLEIKYYPDDDVIYQRELYRLTALLNLDTVKVSNIIFAFDDLESLDEDQQFSLMRNFMTLFENLKVKSNKKYRSKFIFCLRSSTYYNLYRQDFYNTHRASKATCLTSAPSLSEVFNKRFEIILKSDQVRKAQNAETWQEARDILVKICNRVDSSYSDLLVKLNNNNVSNALDDFLSIVSNRRWTQKNVNPAASFSIEEGDYYINDTNILRILSMGESNVYYQTSSTPIRCILPDPGADEQSDLISILVLQAFCFNSHSNLGDFTSLSKLLSADDITEQIANCLFYGVGNYEQKRRAIRKVVERSFAYYEENRFIRKNVDPEKRTDDVKYFIQPRGLQIFDLFFSQSILFSIFRDAYLWDGGKYSTLCSNSLSFQELTLEALKYERRMIELEAGLFNAISARGMWRNYISFFGPWSTSESFLAGIKRSVQQYYKDDPVPQKIASQLNEYERRTASLTAMFESRSDEHILF